MNSNAIGQDKFYQQDGPNFHGFGTEEIPNNPLGSYNFNTSWDKSAATPIDGSLFIRGGKSFNVGSNGKLSLFANASFDNGYKYNEGVSRGGVNVQGVAKRNLFKKSFDFSSR